MTDSYLQSCICRIGINSACPVHSIDAQRAAQAFEIAAQRSHARPRPYEARIESGIPAPRPQSNWQALIEQMKPGDSVVLSSGSAQRFQKTVATNWKQYRVVTRPIRGTRNRRCWLLDKYSTEEQE